MQKSLKGGLKMNEKFVYAELPRTGLCNMLFPWARAVIFARDSGCAMLAPQWVKIQRLGPWIRGEVDKRYYFNQFTNAGYVKGVSRILTLAFRRSRVRVFRGIGAGFDEIYQEANYLREELLRIASTDVVNRLDAIKYPYIALHLRRGDFVRTGLSLDKSYYIRALGIAKEMFGRDLQTLVFSDAPDNEIGYLINGFKNVRRAKRAPALSDMLALSRATVLIGTNNSSFSLWGAFLGSGISLWAKEMPPMREECRFKGMVQI